MALDTTTIPEISKGVTARRAVANSSHSAVISPPRNPGRTRPLRFILVGGLATVTYLKVLTPPLGLDWPAILVNAAVLIASSQVNFVFSACFTWRDRWDAADGALARSVRSLLVDSGWLRFMGAAAGTISLELPCYIWKQPIAVGQRDRGRDVIGLGVDARDGACGGVRHPDCLLVDGDLAPVSAPDRDLRHHSIRRRTR